MPLLGSKPVLRDRCCDGMIDKCAPLPWVEVQDLPRRGARENEKGEPGEILTPQPPQKTPDPTTTASRNHTVICQHLEKNKIYSTQHFTQRKPPQTLLLSKNPCQKQPHSALGSGQAARALGRAYGSLSTPQGGRACPNPTEPSTSEFPHGAPT